MVAGLEGIRVIETASVLAGPMTGRLLADFGADVIHIEHPVRGDIARSQSAKRKDGRAIISDIDYAMQNHSRNKRDMTLDLFQDGGREIMYKLLEKADVFLSNFRPRELHKFKLDYDILSKLNPRLICANLTGYNREGPDKDAPAYEHGAYFSRAGILHVLQAPGLPPDQNPVGFGDYIAGVILAYGIMTALFIRERTGTGQEVDTSLFNAGVYALSHDISGSLVSGQDRQPIERKDFASAMANLYQTKDGRWLRLGISQPDIYWSRFCQAIERQDLEHDPRFDSFDLIIDNHIALFHILEEVFASKSLDEWKPRLDKEGLPWSPLQTLPEVINDPQARANDFFIAFEHPTYGRIEVVANPVKLSKTPETIRLPAPEFGQHTEEVLLEYGYTWDDISRFKELGVIA
ncbi:MAG: CoA transferase [Dehalococcoidales bacterium]|nr:CoA transferase [Dehalococcoidales bacterium]